MLRNPCLAIYLCVLLGIVGFVSSQDLIESCSSDNVYQAVDKQLIYNGWHAPDAVWVSRNPQSIQGSPFDGIAFRMTNADAFLFENRLWTTDDVPLEVLGQVPWGDLDENFIKVLAQSPKQMDWFDEARWETILTNTGLLSQAISASGARGIFFDPEFYYSGDGAFSPWVYGIQFYPSHTITEVEALVRQRGASFMEALQTHTSDVRVLSYFLGSRTFFEAEGDPAQKDWSNYALIPAFFSGMLSVADAEAVIIDGNEDSYYIDDTLQFTQQYQFIREQSVSYYDTDVRTQYGDEVQVSFAIYPDYVMELWPEYDRGRSEEYSLRWLEHNLYHALLVSDQYVWWYDEIYNWFGYINEGLIGLYEPSGGVMQSPSDAVRALVPAVRERLISEQGLGYEMSKPYDYRDNPDIDAEWLPLPAIMKVSSQTVQLGEPVTVTLDAPQFNDYQFDLYINSRYYQDFRTEIMLSDLPLGVNTLFVRGTRWSDLQHFTSPPTTVRVGC